MKKSINNFLRYCFFALFLIPINHVFGQEPTPATIVNSNPSDQDILDALNGGGMTLSLKNGLVDGFGLLHGELDVELDVEIGVELNYSQIAIFTDGDNANLGMNDGILFSTGNAVEDLSTRNQHEDRSNWNGLEATFDQDLLSIDNEAYADIIVYKFEATLAAHTSAIRVVFQFGSEEYPNTVGTRWNDAFGFFVRAVSPGASLPGAEAPPPGSSINFPVYPGFEPPELYFDERPVINIARLPNSNTPITVNSVNYGVVGSLGDINYPGLDLTNSEYYINNGHYTGIQQDGRLEHFYFPYPATGDPLPYVPVYIQYNGLTKLITYDLKDLTPGATYEFKIAIADTYGEARDSGVLIKKIQGTTGADVKIEKEVNNMTPTVGDEVEFTLTASNLGPYEGINARVNDLLPSGYEYVSHEESTGSYDSTTGLWQIGNMQVDQMETLTIKAIIKNIGEHKNIATITSDDLDPDYENNMASVEPILSSPPCVEETIFTEDFGESDPYDFEGRGRAISPYMPAGGYEFGKPYPNYEDEQTSIPDGYYAVIAPGFIKASTHPDNLGSYLWTPAYDEIGTVADVSGTWSGAVMAVNAGSTIRPFYQREVSLEHDKIYRVSFWIYVVQDPAQIAVNVIDRETGAIFGEVVSNVYMNPSTNWASVELYFKVPAESEVSCDMTDAIISLRSNQEVAQGNNFYIDDISFAKLTDDPVCHPSSIMDLKCPRLIITNPMMLNQGR